MALSTLSTCLSPEIDSTAIIIPRQLAPIVFSHRELHRQVLSFQKKLASIGVSYKDTVAIALPNSLEFVVAFLAISLQRAICAPLNPAYKADEFEFYLDDLDASVLLLPKDAISEKGEAVRAARACNTAVAEIYWDWCEINLEIEVPKGLAKKSPVGLNRPEKEDIALILHTSGTTGRPKAVPLTHKNLCRTMVNIQNTYHLNSADRTLLVMPLFHVHGLVAGFLSPLMSHGSVIVPARFSASDFWRDFINHRANWYTAVPTIHQALLKNNIPSSMPQIRFIRSCSSPLAPTLHQQLETMFKAPVIEAYAMTEAAHQMTSNPLAPGLQKPGSVGLPQGVALQIVDDTGYSVAPGQIGEVAIRGENVTSGYLGNPTVAASPFTASGYLRTGDQGYLDHEGYLFLTGRIKELINKGGEKISPIEIDNIFLQHPKVQEAVSFAIEDEFYGQNVGVAITLREGTVIPAAELLAWFGERAAKFKLPKKVYYIEKMPKTATGKVQRSLVAKTMLEKEKQAADNIDFPVTKTSASSESEGLKEKTENGEERRRGGLWSRIREVFCT